MSKIIGNTVGIPNPISDWNQTNPNKADYIKNKPQINLSDYQKKLSEKQLADINDINNVKQRVERLEADVSIATNTAGSAYELANSAYEKAEGKQDKAIISYEQPDTITGYFFNVADSYNKDIRLDEAPLGVYIFFPDDAYADDYIAGLSFRCIETPPWVSYEANGIINWVGTDCTTDSYIDDNGVETQVSIFQPSVNTQYDIVFYFNGKQFIGLVNGFKPASANRKVVS